MANDIPLINGIRHSWASVKINMLGRTISGAAAISYEDKVEKVNNYGAGQMPVSRGKGKYEANAKITLHAYEDNAIQKAIGAGKRLQDIAPFDVVVAYLPEGQDTLVTDTIRNCEFTMKKRDIKSGDIVIEVEHELIVSHITWG